MIKNVARFQRILASSATYRSQNGKVKNSMSVWIVFLIVLGGNLLITPVFDSGGGILVFPVLSMLYVYRIVNSGNKIYELVPVTKDYIVGNIFLSSIIFLVLCFVLLSAIGYMVLGLVLLLVLLFGGQSSIASLFASGIQFSADFDGILFILLVMLIALFVFTALSFINIRKLRLTALICFSVGSYVLLLLLKGHFPAQAGGTGDFFMGFRAMPQARSIVRYTFLMCILVIPLSILAGRRFYRSRFKVQERL